MSQTPAGWHPAPDRPGQLRYWDGTQWTDNYSDPAASLPGIGSGAPVGAETTTLASMPGGVGSPQSRNWFLEHKVVSVVLVLLLVGVVGAALGGDETGDDKAQDGQGAASSQPSDSDTPSEDTSAASEPSTEPSIEPTTEPTTEPEPSTPGAKCTRIKQFGGLTDGLKKKDTTILAGFTVPLGEDQRDFNVENIAAIRVEGDGKSADVLLLVTDPQVDGGTVLAAGAALDWFVFGDMADDDSPVGEYRNQVIASPAADDALACFN